MEQRINPRDLTLLLTLAAAFAAATTARAAKPSDRELAQKIVGTCVSIQPGDVVVVAGGKHVIPLMEEVAIAAQEAGGLVTMFLSSDRVGRSRSADIPEEYLQYEPHYFKEWVKQIDVWIGLPNSEDPEAIRQGVSESRLAKMARGGRSIREAVSEATLRGVFVGMPTRQTAQRVGVDFKMLSRIGVSEIYRLL